MAGSAVLRKYWGHRRSGFSPTRRLWAAVLVLAATTPAYAAGWLFTPQIGVTETYSDNVSLAPSGQQRSDFVTEIKPKIQIRGTGARVKLTLDYELQEILYARNSSRNRTQNALNGTGTVEAVEKFLFVDARAVISQQSISALGPQTFSNANITTNSTESRLFSISPYIRGVLGSFASYEVRHNAVRTSADSGAIATSHSNEWIARARNAVPLASFGWALDYSQRTVGFGNSSDSELESGKATLFYQFDPQFRASVNAGRENNNYSLTTQSYSNQGFGFEWRPTPRTQVSAQRDRRFFGTGHNYRFSHRTPLSSWSLGYLRDIATSADRLQVDVPSDFYTLLFNSPAYIALYPDPVERDQRVREALVLLGLPASAGNQALLANRIFLDRRLDASVALLGARNALTLSVYRSERSAVSGISSGVDVFTNASTVRQRGLNLSWTHKLSAISSLNFLASRIHSLGVGPSTQDSTQRLLNLSLIHQFTPKTTGSLGLRKVQFDSQGGTTGSYDEKALTGTVSHTF